MAQDWKFPFYCAAELNVMVRLEGQPQQDLFFLFIEKALRFNVEPDIIVRACLETNGSIHRLVMECGGEKYVRRIITLKLNELPPRDRKEITITVRGADTDKHWRKVEQALIEKKKCPVFVRKNKLVQPLWRWHQDSDGRKYLSAELQEYSLVQLTDMVAHYAVQFKIMRLMKAGNVELRESDPPKQIIEALHGASNFRFPDIIGFITSPTLRPDLSILHVSDEPGYDEPTQLYHKSGGDITLPPIAERPARRRTTRYQERHR